MVHSYRFKVVVREEAIGRAALSGGAAGLCRLRKPMLLLPHRFS